MLNFIYNPTAGNGKCLKFKDVISAELTKRNIPHVFHKTFFKHHATEIAKQLTTAGCRDIIVLGGDGTLHEVLNGIEDPANVNLGLIPCGSGNDFASTACIPIDAIKALEIILSGSTRYVDYLECSGVRGINVIGTGIDVDILKRCYSSKILKGKAKYLISTVISLIKYKCKKILVKTDSTCTDHECFIACAGNGKDFGGGIPIAPEADTEDGLIDFVLINSMKWYKKPITLLNLVSGKILKSKKAFFRRTTKAQIISKTKYPIEIDGEIYENLEFNVSIMHNKLRMFLPEKKITAAKA